MAEIIALVTGAAHGIGLEVCRQLGEKGATVYLTARTLEKAAEAAKPLVAAGYDVRPKALDVADDASVEALARELSGEIDRLDVLINNAAVFSGWNDTVSTADLAAVHAGFETNVFGPWRMVRAFLPLIKKSARGRIVNVSSGMGSHSDAGYRLGGSASTPMYAISKAALNAMTAKLAAELKGTPILVNAICPGFTATNPGMAEMGARPVAEGAASVVWGVYLPDDGPTGGFFRDGKALGW